MSHSSIDNRTNHRKQISSPIRSKSIRDFPKYDTPACKRIECGASRLVAKTINIDDLEIKIIDLPTFIVLKIFAWSDRHDHTNKDLVDIDFVLSKYEDEIRVYDELYDQLASGAINFNDGDIYLLGRDIYKMLEEKTLLELNIQLNKLIDSLGDDPQSLGYKSKYTKQRY